VQVEIKQLNAVNKEVQITVEAERAMKSYNKFLGKASKEVSVPGFRKGKAPLAMVERMYADRVIDLFYKEMVDECFDAACEEHGIHYLHYPNVKDITWEKDQEMQIVVEIESEPIVEFKQLTGMQVPCTLIELDDEIDKYIESLRKENSLMNDVEDSIQKGDEVEAEITILVDDESKVFNNVHINLEAETNAFLVDKLENKNIGDVVEMTMSGTDAIVLLEMDGLSHEATYPVKMMINAILRKTIPELNDDFAKDLEFDNVADMRAKISVELSPGVEHRNINIRQHAYITKLFIDNPFPLPERTLDYIVQKETEKVTDARWKRFYEYQVKMQVSQEMISLYVMNNLKSINEVEITEEAKSDFIAHLAILEDMSAEQFVDKRKSYIESNRFAEELKDYILLTQLTAQNEYIPVSEESPMEEPLATEISELLDTQTEEDTTLKQADIFSE